MPLHSIFQFSSTILYLYFSYLSHSKMLPIFSCFLPCNYLFFCLPISLSLIFPLVCFFISYSSFLFILFPSLCISFLFSIFISISMSIYFFFFFLLFHPQNPSRRFSSLLSPFSLSLFLLMYFPFISFIFPFFLDFHFFVFSFHIRSSITLSFLLSLPRRLDSRVLLLSCHIMSFQSLSYFFYHYFYFYFFYYCS